MSRGPIIFLTALVAFALSFAAFVLAPQIQVGRQALTKPTGGSTDYPQARPGQAAQGAQVYRANGCAYCHSQQVRQQGVVFDVALTDVGKNPSVLVAALMKVDPKLDAAAAQSLAEKVPQYVLRGVPSKTAADAAKATLDAAAGARAGVRVVPVGADISRGWGVRHSVAADYLYDSPVLLGAQRVGPDLANVGLRLPDANWHLIHLYNPRAVVTNSTMPPHQFLFQTRKIVFAPSAEALKLPAGFEPPAGYEVVPTDEARALVAYLQSLRVTAPLFEAPLAAPLVSPQPEAVTNTAAK